MSTPNLPGPEDDEEITRSRSQFRWTEEAKLRFAKCVKHRKGYITTPDLAMIDKFRLVKTDLKNYVETAELDVTSEALNNHFTRLQSAVLDQYGISKEGANLSGLEEVPTDYVSLMISMAEEKAKDKKKKSAKKNKKKTEQRVMSNIEQNGLNRQSNLDHDLSSSATAEVDESTISSRSSPSPQGVNILTNMHNDLMSVLQENDEEGAALERELKRAKIEESKQKAELGKVQLEREKQELDESKQKAELGKVQLEREKQELDHLKRKQELEIKLLERQLEKA